jgi:hypothetical protein
MHPSITPERLARPLYPADATAPPTALIGAVTPSRQIVSAARGPWRAASARAGRARRLPAPASRSPGQPRSGESAGRQALHRADPGPLRLGCLRLGQLEVATQDDRGTLAGRQLGKGATRTANVGVSRRQRVRVGTSVGPRYERGPGRAGDPASTGGMSMQNPWPLAALRRVFSRPEATSAVWSHAAERSPR